MTRERTAVVLALAGALLLIAVGLLASSASAGGGTTAIGVRNGECEFSFYLTRTKVKPGPAIIQYTNTCEDPHDLRVQREGSNKEVGTGVTVPGGVSTLPQIKLKAKSRYVFWCSLEGHREDGMEAVLKVKRKN